MISIIVVLSVLLVAIAIVAIREDSKRDNIDKFDENGSDPYITKCGCGKTKSVDGHCDGSHADS